MFLPGHILKHHPFCFLCISLLFLLQGGSLRAQEMQQTEENRRLRPQPDSAGRDRTGRLHQEPARQQRGSGFSLLFADSSQFTDSDYQLLIEKIYVQLNNIESRSKLSLPVKNIESRLMDTDSVLAVLKDNTLNNSHALNVRNLQVFKTLLQNIQAEMREYRVILDSTGQKLDVLRASLKGLREDTVLRQLLSDTMQRRQFNQQLKDMRSSWRSAAQQLRLSIATINLLQTHTSSNSITTTQLLERTDNLLSTSASRIFGKEYNYLWEKPMDTLSQAARTSVGKVYDGEKKALHYYFKDSSNTRLLLLVIGFLFFAWVYRNLIILRRLKAVSRLTPPDFEYLLPQGVFPAALVVLFSIAPLFDLHAPSSYIEAIQFLMLLALTFIFWRKWPRSLFGGWISIAVLYIFFSFTHHIADPGFRERCWLILLNTLSILAGRYFQGRMRAFLPHKNFLRIVMILYNTLNVLAILFNIWGRFSLAQILGSAAIFAFTQAIGLIVFSQLVREAILLQIITSRLKRRIKASFDRRQLLHSVDLPLRLLVIFLWLIVFATNLNVYTSLLDALTGFFQKPRNIGSAWFTIGGVVIFFLIIWIAHLLQKYVGYFFGDAGNDEDINDKGQRSRLLIARLIVLCLGYLLAIAASGVPVDKITIVLGALGVGIGLGLQNIVSNFVSGIILIFDRPLQIGDSVEIGNKAGRVKEIGLRSSTLLTDNGAEIIIPNGDLLSQQIVNWTLNNSQMRLEMLLSVTGSTDMETVSSAVKKAILSSPYVFKKREPQVLFTKIYDNGFDLKAYFWCPDALKSGEAKSETLLLIYKGLKEKNIDVKSTG